jgi:UDP-N-acetylglucosamine 2-epimerase (non-hydrolysing)
MKVLTVLGTRPEIIRLSRVMARLDSTPGVAHVLVHTGQNYDYGLNQVFFDDLGIRAPDHYLACDTSSLGHMYGDVMVKAEKILQAEQPEAVLVLGDTNSALSAIIARRMHIPVFHMEAGNRSFDWSVPEETNRRIVDHIADVNLVYTEHARQNLLREGIHPQRVYLTGSPMFEVLEHYRSQIEASDVLERLGVRPGSYLMVSLHREENVDDPDRLGVLISSLAAVSDRHELQVLVSTHPRTRSRLAATGLGDTFAAKLQFCDPFGFHDYNRLQMCAACVVSDSGTISEEAGILGFPAVTPREWIERPEALDAGTVVMTGVEATRIVRAVEFAISAGPPLDLPTEYQVRNCSDRVVRLLLGRDRSLRDTAR